MSFNCGERAIRDLNVNIHKEQKSKHSSWWSYPFYPLILQNINSLIFLSFVLQFLFLGLPFVFLHKVPISNLSTSIFTSPFYHQILILFIIFKFYPVLLQPTILTTDTFIFPYLPFISDCPAHYLVHSRHSVHVCLSAHSYPPLTCETYTLQDLLPKTSTSFHGKQIYLNSQGSLRF